MDGARSGVYPATITNDVSPERLARFFVKVDSGYQIVKAVRETCIFARQDVTKDPPFSRMDIVSCRNVLIYMNAVLQRRVFPIFHYSLNPDGLLLLGSAESITVADDLFQVQDKAEPYLRSQNDGGPRGSRYGRWPHAFFARCSNSRKPAHAN